MLAPREFPPREDTQRYSIGYDPSAGSPTETLLRLLLPLKDQVRTSFSLAVNQGRTTGIAPFRSSPRRARPKASLNHSIGSSDGRCVQRAGT